MSPRHGDIETLAPGVRRVIAPNPGPMTGDGTNTYIVGSGPVAIIDPGVDDPAHLAAIRAAAGREIAAILLTHRHRDHVGGAAALADATGAPVRALAKESPGVYDAPLAVDLPIGDGDILQLGELSLAAIHTPGHASDHLCFHLRESALLFAGDTVMADVTVVILPPDGDMSAYLASLERLRRLAVARIAPGHGRMLDEPEREFAQIMAHRLEREAQVRRALALSTVQTAAAIADVLYPGIDPRLQPMAAAQVEAHLIRLAEQGEAVRDHGGWRALLRG